MRLDWLRPVVHAAGPFAGVHLDVSRVEAGADRHLELRWKAAEHQLRDDGAGEAMVSLLRETVLSPTGAGGRHGRSVVATADGVLLDRVLPRPPVRDSARHGLVPDLMPLVRGLDPVTSHVLVQADHRGADVTVVGGLDGHVDGHQVDGGHDVLHLFGAGGWAHRRYQTRVLDSWERNAEAVAADLDRVVARHSPQLVLLTGAPQSVAFVRRHATDRVAQLLVELDTGGRADGISQEALVAAVDAATTTHRQRAMGEIVARFEQTLGKGGAAVEGLAAVVDTLRQGAVDILLLHDDPLSTARLWAGPEPLQLGTSADDVRALGASEVVEERADAVFVRALAGQSGGVELVSGVDVPRGGIGALLRFDARPPAPG